jgi:hypothetical protein
MDDGGDTLEQRLLIDLADRQTVGFVVQERQVGPPAGQPRDPIVDNSTRISALLSVEAPFSSRCARRVVDSRREARPAKRGAEL